MPRVAAVDPIEGRREVAAASGADLVLPPGDDDRGRDRRVEQGRRRRAHHGDRPDRRVHPYLGAWPPAPGSGCSPGSRRAQSSPVVANDIHYNEWEIVGASSCRLDGFHAVAGLIADGRLQVADLIGSQLPLDRTGEALELAASGKDMRVGVDPWA